ncbi:hypothetical protein TURU_106427 [Turdus rufiventris]|nr:hypothetical protein TURU_106427 [Turdus rufiventris]
MFRHEEYYQVDDSDVSEFSELMGSTGDLLVRDISIADGHSKGGCTALPEFIEYSKEEYQQDQADSSDQNNAPNDIGKTVGFFGRGMVCTPSGLLLPHGNILSQKGKRVLA